MSNTCRGDNLSPAKMKNLKNKKGITLIALVITIIVLLILAGVALSLVVGEDGITGRAVNAGKTQNIAGAKEKLELDVANYASEFYKEKYVSSNQSATSLKDYILGKIVDGADYTVEDKDTTTGEFQISIADGTNATGTVGEDGSVSWNGMSTEPLVKWTQTGTSVTNGTVNLTVGQAVTGYSVAVDETTYGDGSWYVLGAKNGKLLITMNTCPETVTLSGSDGYINGIATLNAAAEKYTNPTYASGNARSIDVDDINRVTGYDPKTAGGNNTPAYSGELYEYGNKVTYYWQGSANAPYYSASNGLTGSLSYPCNEGFFYPTASGFTKSEKSTTATTENKELITTLTNTYYDYSGSSKIDSSIPAYTLLFSNTGNYPGDTGSYWLGSQCVDCDTNVAYFGLRSVFYGCVASDGLVGSGSGEGEGSKSLGLRPVVSLQSGVQVTSAGAISVN